MGTTDIDSKVLHVGFRAAVFAPTAFALSLETVAAAWRAAVIGITGKFASRGIFRLGGGGQWAFPIQEMGDRRRDIGRFADLLGHQFVDEIAVKADVLVIQRFDQLRLELLDALVGDVTQGR